MPIIIIITLAIYLVLAIGTWHYLGSVEKNKKIIFILIGIIVSYLITLIVFSISKSGIIYPNLQIGNAIQNVIVAVFSSLNGILFLPYLGRLCDKIHEDEITKGQFQKRVCILVVIVIFMLILETNYLKNMQTGILDIYQNAVNNG